MVIPPEPEPGPRPSPQPGPPIPSDPIPPGPGPSPPSPSPRPPAPPPTAEKKRPPEADDVTARRIRQREIDSFEEGPLPDMSLSHDPLGNPGPTPAEAGHELD